MTPPAKEATAIPFDETISAYGQARATIKEPPLSPEELRKIDEIIIYIRFTNNIGNNLF